MKRFASQYDGKAIQDDGAYPSKEFLSLARKFKNAIKREMPEFDLQRYKVGHYDVSGFLVREGVAIYFSWDVPRYGDKIDTSESGCHRGVLYRTAATTSDYCGGANNFCSLEEFGKSVRSLYEREQRAKDPEEMEM